MAGLFTASKRHNFRFQENLYTDLAWAHKNAGRAQALSAVECFMVDSFACFVVGIIFPPKLRYTWNNGEIKT